MGKEKKKHILKCCLLKILPRVLSVNVMRLLNVQEYPNLIVHMGNKGSYFTLSHSWISDFNNKLRILPKTLEKTGLRKQCLHYLRQQFETLMDVCKLWFIRGRVHPASILYKSTAGRYRPVSYPDGPITARCRFIKNAYWAASYNAYVNEPSSVCSLFPKGPFYRTFP